jgi:uncharacterized protein (DUF697 family)
MAKLYFGNHGDIELQSSTLNALRLLPKKWTVVLNVRPVGHNKDREVDALIVTERALHVVEFKFRSNPVHIQTEHGWYQGRQLDLNGLNESPKEQVSNTTEAFKLFLGSRQRLRHLKEALLPWVILERFNSENTYDGQPFRRGRYERVGHVRVLNGVENLHDQIASWENDAKKLPATGINESEDLPIILRELSVVALDELTVHGYVRSLESGDPLTGMTVQINSHAMNTYAPFAKECQTNEHGSFEFVGLPVDKFDVEISGSDKGRVLPSRTYSANSSLVRVHLYLVSPGIDEARVQELLEERIQDIKQEVVGLEDYIIEATSSLEQRIDVCESKISKAAEDQSNAVQELWNELAILRQEQHRVDLLSDADFRTFARNTLEPLRAELVEVRRIADRAMNTAQEAKGFSEEASKRAARALQESQAAKEEARDSKAYQQQRVDLERDQARIAQERWETEQVDAERLSENQQRMSRAMSVSVLVGIVGGILSLQPLPGPDIVILTPMQVGLVMSISRIYGRELTQNMIMQIIAALGAGMVGQHLTVLLYKLIPGAWALGAITVPATFVLLGWATAKFLERGTMPTTAERTDVMVRIKNALTDPVLLKEARETASSVVQEFRSQGASSLKPETIRDVFERAGRDHPELGKRLLDHLNQPKRPNETD